MAKEYSLEEYKIISENLRWYSNMRFAQLTLFVAITAALANWLFSDKPPIFLFAASNLKASRVTAGLAVIMRRQTCSTNGNDE